MNNHIQITFSPVSTEQAEMLIALLSEAGFDGFEEEANVLKAFVPAAQFQEGDVKDIAVRMQVPFEMLEVAQRNWNEVWESSFEPVVVEDFVAVRAAFHESVRGVMHEIIITPKMSFGTGHHATTWLMMQEMRAIDFNGQTVLDFGTGTGVLAILAEKMGATSVTAIDNDEWSITNARENIERNEARSITLLNAGSAEVNERFGVILANINKNVILDNFGLIRQRLLPGGTLLLSGLLVADLADIREVAGQLGLRVLHHVEKHNWLLLRLSY
jgi:ribosomal protein L11 methyltransferase